MMAQPALAQKLKPLKPLPSNNFKGKPTIEQSEKVTHCGSSSGLIKR
jgi:hypothetical protein